MAAESSFWAIDKSDMTVVVGVSSLSGLAALLRSRKRLTTRVVVAHLLSSVVSGVMVYLLTVERFRDAHMFHLGICALAGAGGGTTLDVLSVIFFRFLEKFNLTPENRDE